MIIVIKKRTVKLRGRLFYLVLTYPCICEYCINILDITDGYHAQDKKFLLNRIPLLCGRSTGFTLGCNNSYKRSISIIRKMSQTHFLTHSQYFSIIILHIYEYRRFQFTSKHSISLQHIPSIIYQPILCEYTRF